MFVTLCFHFDSCDLNIRHSFSVIIEANRRHKETNICLFYLKNFSLLRINFEATQSNTDLLFDSLWNDM